MRWFLNNDLAVAGAIIIILAAGGGIGAIVHQHMHNSCVVEVSKSGKSAEEAQGLCK